MRQLTRLQPQLPVEQMKTYQVIAPKETHFRPATCAEMNCLHYINGWASAIDESTDLGKQQAYYIRNNSGRSFTEDRNLMPGLTLFKFEAGQQCFAQHQTRLGKPEIYVVKDGDWRGSSNIRKHVNADDWVDDFANHQDKLAERLKEG